MNPTQQHTATWKVILAWLVVVLPATWGIAQTVRKSLPLFEFTAKTPTTQTTK